MRLISYRNHSACNKVVLVVKGNTFTENYVFLLLKILHKKVQMYNGTMKFINDANWCQVTKRSKIWIISRSFIQIVEKNYKTNEFNSEPNEMFCFIGISRLMAEIKKVKRSISDQKNAFLSMPIFFYIYLFVHYIVIKRFRDLALGNAQ